MSATTRFCVVDASFTMRTLLPNSQRESALEKLADLGRRGASLCAPTLWYYEVTSALTKLVHFAHVKPEEAAAALEIAMQLPLALVTPHEIGWERPVKWTASLGRAAAYDSFYLALAESRGLEMWTADRKLHGAVSRSWLHLL